MKLVLSKNKYFYKEKRMFENFKLKIISYIYNISKQPVKLDKLLEANLLFAEGMKLDGTKLGFRLRLGRAYIVFLTIANIIIFFTIVSPF